MLILLADDDEELRYILARVLKKEGYQVREIGDLGALQTTLAGYPGNTIGAPKPNILVSDVYMPGGQGTALDVVEGLKERLGELAIVFITSARDLQLNERATALGARGVFSKPVDMDALKKLLREIAVEKRNKRRVNPTHGAD